MKWTLDEARALIQQLQRPSRRLGYHLCLGGGVLNAGQSHKDLDLYFLPLDNDIDPQPEGLAAWLKIQLGPYEEITKEYPDDPSSTHYVWKRKFDFDGKRIDVFVTR